MLDSGVGDITESDVLTAAAGKAIIVGFHTKPETKVEQIASQQGVRILLFDIIYEAVDTIRVEMAALLAAHHQGEAARQGRGPPGLQHHQGRHHRRLGGHRGRHQAQRPRPRHARAQAGPHRQDRLAASGSRTTSARCWRRFECGIGIENFSDFKVGDVIECYELEEIRQSID